MNSGNPLEETNASELSDNLDQRRRRLIRGVASAAPVVLTLRSGALAAASCTGAKVLTYVGDGDKLEPATGIQADDVCVVNFESTSCSPDSGLKISRGDFAGKVVQQGGNLRCEFNLPKGQQVAILSSAAASSLNILPR